MTKRRTASYAAASDSLKRSENAMKHYKSERDTKIRDAERSFCRPDPSPTKSFRLSFRILMPILLVALLITPLPASSAQDKKAGKTGRADTKHIIDSGGDVRGDPGKDAGDARVERLIDILQKRYDQTMAISARFRQKTFAPGDPKGVTASGKVYFKRPHLMRWEYEKPAKQLIVTSNKDVYIYEIEARQITILPRKQFLSSEISRAFFFGRGDLRRDFTVAPAPAGAKNPSWTLCLKPKSQAPQLKMLLITLDPASHLLTRVIIEDQMGSHTVIQFSDIRVNRNLPPSLFKFVVPEGVEIYRGQ